MNDCQKLDWISFAIQEAINGNKSELMQALALVEELREPHLINITIDREMNDWIKWGEANPPRFLQRADETVFVVRNETVTQTTNENKNPAMKGNRNPFAQNSVM